MTDCAALSPTVPGDTHARARRRSDQAGGAVGTPRAIAVPGGHGLGTYGETVRQTQIDPETGELLALLQGALSPAQRRARKYDRARQMARVLQHKDLAGCHAWVRSKADPVGIHAKKGVQRSGFFTNLQTCGMVHLCAHCQAKIAARRAGEIQQAVDAWKAEGGDVIMVTLTLSHGRPDPLVETLGALKDAGRRLARHRAYSEATQAAGLVGRIVATEFTHGANGWHPHQHQLWFVRPGVDHAQLKAQLDDAWRASLQRSGFTASEARGVKVNGASKAARYVSKMGAGEGWTLADELARSASKVGRNGSRSVWELVDVSADKAATAKERGAARRLLREFSQAVTGTKALTWSPGLKKRFLVTEADDKTLADEAQEDDTHELASVPTEFWPAVVKGKAQAQVLTAAEDGGQPAVVALVQALRPAGDRGGTPQVLGLSRARPVSSVAPRASPPQE
jgi:hypothetical protein